MILRSALNQIKCPAGCSRVLSCQSVNHSNAPNVKIQFELYIKDSIQVCFYVGTHFPPNLHLDNAIYPHFSTIPLYTPIRNGIDHPHPQKKKDVGHFIICFSICGS